MKEQLKLLIELQRHDAKIQEFEVAKKAWPEKLAAMRADLDKVEGMLGRERAQLEETEAWRRKQEEELRGEESQLIKAKQKAQLVKNAKEHMANERELQQTRKMAQEREEEVQKLVGAVETAQKSIAQHEQDLVGLREHVAKQEEAAKAKMAEIDGQIAEEKKLRDEAAARVRPDVLKKYSTIRMRRGLAVVAAKNGTCQGCNMNIPPQVFNILQKGNSLELCGSCNRIIYWEKILEEGAAPA